MKEEIKRLLSIKCLKDATNIASQNGWRIPKNRFDLRAEEIVNDKNFWRCLLKDIINTKI
jgi:hypothetical protein